MKPIRPRLNSALLFVSLLVCSLSGFSQQFLTTIGGWNAYVHLPDDYDGNRRKLYPTIIFFPGTGETGTDASALLRYGPGHFIAQGNNLNSFNVNGQTIKPIIICLQPPFLYPQPWQLNLMFDAILARWRVDPSQLNLTGLSMGGFCGDNFVTESVANSNRINSMVNMSAVIPNYPITNFSFYALSGGKAWWFEGLYDNRGMDQMTAIMNATVPGSARYTSYVGGHCCWNTWYDPGYTENINGQNWNIYQWMLAQRKVGIPFPPAVDAGPDQTLSKRKTNLAGSASANNGGNIVSTNWTEVSGPNTANIQSPDQLSTKISGLQPGVYVFMLSATDNNGLTNQQFFQADGEDLPFKNKEFDYAICCHVLEHVPHPEKFVSEQTRVAGRGYIETPSLLGCYLAPKKSHQWVLLDIDDKIVMYDKKLIGFDPPP